MGNNLCFTRTKVNSLCLLKKITEVIMITISFGINTIVPLTTVSTELITVSKYICINVPNARKMGGTPLIVPQFLFVQV